MKFKELVLPFILATSLHTYSQSTNRPLEKEPPVKVLHAEPYILTSYEI